MRNNNYTTFMLLAALLVLSLAACDRDKKHEEEESAKIQEYLRNNSNLNFILKPSGLYYLEVEAGSGPIPVMHDTAYIKYTGRFLNGLVFDSNTGVTDTLISPVNEGWLKPGFDEGITYMKEGGKAIFLLPSKLAFGPEGIYPYIQGYTPVLFDVELVKVKAGPGE